MAGSIIVVQAGYPDDYQQCHGDGKLARRLDVHHRCSRDPSVERNRLVLGRQLSEAAILLRVSGDFERLVAAIPPMARVMMGLIVEFGRLLTNVRRTIVATAAAGANAGSAQIAPL